MAAKDETQLAFTGNCYIEHRVSVHQNKSVFHKLIELLQNSDLSFANMECAIQDGEDWPAFGSGMGWAGTVMGAPPSMIDELKFMGISAVYAANNHVADFGELGILTTIDYLKRGGMPYAGIGASLTEAAQPTYLETENARVALIALADWGPRQMMDLPFPWPAGYMGSDELPPYKSRPGVNLLRYDSVAHVDRAAFDQLKRISQELNWERGKVVRFQGAARTETLIGSTLKGWEKDTDSEFFFMGRKFILSDKFRMSTVPYQEDLERTYKHIAEARRHADVVIVALHDQAHGVGVRKTATPRRQQHDRRRHVQRFHRLEERAWLHHHAGAAAKRIIVDRLVAIMREIAQVNHAVFHRARHDRLCRNAHGQRTREELGEDRDEVDAQHGAKTTPATPRAA